MAWITDYQPTEYNKVFDCTDGDHLIRIKEAKPMTSQSQKNMVIITYVVQGSNGIPYVDRIVSGDYFDSNMTRFFDAFKIERGNFNFQSWIGKEATAHFEHRVSEFTDKNGNKKTSNKSELTKVYTPDNSAPVNRAAIPTQNQQSQSDYADFKEDFPGF